MTISFWFTNTLLQIDLLSRCKPIICDEGKAFVTNGYREEMLVQKAVMSGSFL